MLLLRNNYKNYIARSENLLALETECHVSCQVYCSFCSLSYRRLWYNNTMIFACTTHSKLLFCIVNIMFKIVIQYQASNFHIVTDGCQNGSANTLTMWLVLNRVTEEVESDSWTAFYLLVAEQTRSARLLNCSESSRFSAVFVFLKYHEKWRPEYGHACFQLPSRSAHSKRPTLLALRFPAKMNEFRRILRNISQIGGCQSLEFESNDST